KSPHPLSKPFLVLLHNGEALQDPLSLVVGGSPPTTPSISKLIEQLISSPIDQLREEPNGVVDPQDELPLGVSERPPTSPPHCRQGVAHMSRPLGVCPGFGAAAAPGSQATRPPATRPAANG